LLPSVLNVSSQRIDDGACPQERQKSGDTTASSAQHAELLERIHTAKLLRESNQTLRDENESSLRKITQLDTRLRQSLAELDPLKEQVQTLHAEVESKDHNIKLLEEDNERWKNRNQTILAKYERIDPEELHVLKSEVEEVKARLVEVEREKEIQLEEQTKLVRFSARLSLVDVTDPTRDRSQTESMKEKWVEANGRFKALQVLARTTRDEKAVLLTEIAELKTKMAAGTDSTVRYCHSLSDWLSSFVC
jgi:nucleoprotein TPR